MGLLLLKLILTPLLIGGATLAGRRWGASIGGWLIALPLTSGPVAFFLALGHGTAFAASAAVGSLLGVLAIGVFALAYAWCAARWRWPVALAASAVGYVVAAAVLRPLAGAPLALSFALVLVGLAVVLALLPSGGAASMAGPPPWWDLPARLVVGTAVVLILTAVASSLGAALSGLVAIYPVFASILTVFTHHREGPWQAVQVLRGLLAGLFGTAAFFLVLAAVLVGGGIALAFVAALVTALLIQAVALRALRAAGRGDLLAAAGEADWGRTGT